MAIDMDPKKEIRLIGEQSRKAETPLSGICCKTVLLAEDTFSNYLLVSKLLQKQKKYKLLHAENGLEAVEIVKNNPVDLILMDIKMPRMDGITATTEIRKFNPGIPIVILTAYVYEVNKNTALEAGCNEYLPKPLDIHKLMKLLSKYC